MRNRNKHTIDNFLIALVIFFGLCPLKIAFCEDIFTTLLQDYDRQVNYAEKSVNKSIKSLLIYLQESDSIKFITLKKNFEEAKSACTAMKSTRKLIDSHISVSVEERSNVQEEPSINNPKGQLRIYKPRKLNSLDYKFEGILREFKRLDELVQRTEPNKSKIYGTVSDERMKPVLAGTGDSRSEGVKIDENLLLMCKLQTNGRVVYTLYNNKTLNNARIFPKKYQNFAAYFDRELVVEKFKQWGAKHVTLDEHIAWASWNVNATYFNLTNEGNISALGFSKQNELLLFFASFSMQEILMFYNCKYFLSSSSRFKRLKGRHYLMLIEEFSKRVDNYTKFIKDNKKQSIFMPSFNEYDESISRISTLDREIIKTDKTKRDYELIEDLFTMRVNSWKILFQDSDQFHIVRPEDSIIFHQAKDVLIINENQQIILSSISKIEPVWANW